MTTTANIADTFDRIRTRNEETVSKWVEDASAGFLTAEFRSPNSLGVSTVRIVRTDGQALDGPDAIRHAPHVITGVGVNIYASTARKMDRRFKGTLQEVRDAVRTTLVRYVADPPMDAYMALSNFEHRNHLR